MSHVVVNAARPETREQRAWYWYDWANSAYVTTTATVLMSPYLTTVAEAGRLSRPARRPGLHDEPLGARHPRRAGVAVVLHRDLHDDPVRDRPDLHRRHRRPQPATDPALRRLRVGRRPRREPHVLRRRHQLAARRRRSSSSPASASAPRSSSTTRSCAASPTRTSATGSPRRAGRSATSAAASCSRSTSPSTSSTRTSGSTGPCRPASASCPRASGGPASRSSPTSACAT